MRIILTILAACLLFATNGCVSSRPAHPAVPSAGVDHGEYPGDMDHGEKMQQ